MSYARFGWDGDVYVFQTIYDDNLVLECCACWLSESKKLEKPYTDIFGIVHEYSGPEPFYATSSGEMIAHLEKHRDAGYEVSDNTINRIKEDFPNLNETIRETDEERKDRHRRREEQKQRFMERMKNGTKNS